MTTLHHRASSKFTLTPTLTSDGPYKNRQSQLFRELEVLLELTPSTFSSALLALPREIRDRIITHVLPDDNTAARPELHTCLWGADMSTGEPWRHDIFGYASHVHKRARLRPELLLINRQLRAEVLENYWRGSKITLHAELRNNSQTTNSKDAVPSFSFSQHVLKLPMLVHVTHVRFYIEWNYTTLVRVGGSRERIFTDQTRMASSLMLCMDKMLTPCPSIETIELSVLFFWKYRSGKMYSLSMQDLFELEDVFKQEAEARWLRLLGRDKVGKGKAAAAGVGYKASTEKKGTEQIASWRG
ncbi:hypothetical protein BDW02DRAFT_597384 [Decorospora gaudefroyi]|uniref:F-box domain-containing protein n=1 Tax=Decorospora gaudefroyi TaxID=184978 RepID=A0A6A5KM03_9PLEO|nr:hypothetical protein BDW02DRAFT_597384 [Decorospora gaudefroyi]